MSTPLEKQLRLAREQVTQLVAALTSSNMLVENFIDANRHLTEQISSETQRWQYRFIKPIKDSNDSKPENTNTQPNLSPTTK